MGDIILLIATHPGSQGDLMKGIRNFGEKNKKRRTCGICGFQGAYQFRGNNPLGHNNLPSAINPPKRPNQRLAHPKSRVFLFCGKATLAQDLQTTDEWGGDKKKALVGPAIDGGETPWKTGFADSEKPEDLTGAVVLGPRMKREEESRVPQKGKKAALVVYPGGKNEGRIRTNESVTMAPPKRRNHIRK